MTNFNIDFGNIDNNRHLLSVLADIIVCGDLPHVGRGINIPFISTELDNIHGGLITLKKFVAKDESALELINLIIESAADVRSIAKELSGHSNFEPQMMHDQAGNWFIVNPELGFLKRYSKN